MSKITDRKRDVAMDKSLGLGLALPSGLALTLASWAIAWSPIPLIGEYAFFPLWLGYILKIRPITGWSSTWVKENSACRIDS
jgi:hypothetical protein